MTCWPTSTRPLGSPLTRELAVCVDFGSTFTKALLVDLATGAVVAGAEHRTTIDTDVLDGYDGCLAELTAASTHGRRTPRCSPAPAPAAGSGSRWSATRSWSPPRRVAGSRCPAAARWSPSVRSAQGDDLDLAEAAPDVVLLTGGTDGGNHEPIVRRGPTAEGRRLARPDRRRRQRRRPRRGRRDPGRRTPRAGRQRRARRSACWHRPTHAPRSARCSCPTSSAAST